MSEPVHDGVGELVEIARYDRHVGAGGGGDGEHLVAAQAGLDHLELGQALERAQHHPLTLRTTKAQDGAPRKQDFGHPY